MGTPSAAARLPRGSRGQRRFPQQRRQPVEDAEPGGDHLVEKPIPCLADAAAHVPFVARSWRTLAIEVWSHVVAWWLHGIFRNRSEPAETLEISCEVNATKKPPESDLLIS